MSLILFLSQNIQDIVMIYIHGFSMGDTYDRRVFQPVGQDLEHMSYQFT